MQTIAAQLDAAFRQAIQAACGMDADPLITVAQNEKFGDYQSNAAMGLAKSVAEKTGQKTNPRAVAEQIKSNLNLTAIAHEISIAGPGFINIKLSPQYLAQQLQQLSETSRPPLASSRKQRVVVDYSGPNIAKEMHVGHLRSTIIGDALSRIIEFLGHEVIRQNHIGDWGTQFGMLIQRRLETSSSSDQIDDLEEEYRQAKQRFDSDPTFANESRQRVVELQAGAEQVKTIWSTIVDETRRHYQPVYDRLGVKLTRDHERGESFYNQYLAEVVRELTEKNIATESEGAIVVFVPGYENPLIIKKSDGGYLYGTTDLAAIRFRTRDLGANRIIYTHDSRQAQHFAQVFWTAKQASYTSGDQVRLDYAPFGTMLGQDGKPFKSRTGGLIKLKDLLDEAEQRAYDIVKEKNPDLPDDQRRQVARAVGIGAIKYSDLAKDRISDYVFSWESILSMEGNTAPYLQYAYARIKAIFRKSRSMGVPPMSSTIQLDSPFELALAKHILRLGEIIDLVARELKPHHLCQYLYDLATRFSAFYENCPVLQSEEPTRSSRLALCAITANTLALALDLLGIDHPEQM